MPRSTGVWLATPEDTWWWADVAGSAGRTMLGMNTTITTTSPSTANTTSAAITGSTTGLDPQVRLDAHVGSVADPVRAGRARWPLAGLLAGVAGLVGGFATVSNGVTEEDAQAGIDVLDQLERGSYHLAFVAGIVTLIALLFAGAGWRRWANDRGIRTLGGGVIGAGMAATAAVHLIGTAAAGSMSLYLPGGPDEGWLSREAIFVNYTLLDFGMLLAWWGVFASALGVATLSFGRRRVLPRWMGVVSVALMIPPAAFGLGMALPGFPGFVMPIWLAIVSVGMVVSKTAKA